MAERPELVVWLDGAPYTRDHVGGKGQSLGRLVSIGAPVPPAFCVTTHAYRLIAKHLGLPAQTNHVPIDELADMRAAIASTELPEDLQSFLQRNLVELDIRSTGPLSTAVRSSATAEDSENWSFAGLHESVLGVFDQASLERAIKQCWASLWTERAVAYRQHHCSVANDASIAVVVQEMVRSDISVVVFTSDPVTGRSDRLIINSTWGLGESLVSGLVTPDQIVLNEYGEIVEYTIGTKGMMVVPSNDDRGGTRDVVVPRLLREMPTLSQEQAGSIAASARWLAKRLGYAADLEGGIVGDQFHLFQSRPITTLGNLNRSDRQRAA